MKKPKTINEFITEVKKAIAQKMYVTDLKIIELTPPRVLLRIYLKDGLFVSVFYNEINERTAFALIYQGKRIFGANNVYQWHIHPFREEDHHEPSEAIDIHTFFKMLEQYLDIL